MLLFRQCSECDNSNSNSEPETVVINAPRKRYKGKEQSLSDGHRSFEYVANVGVLINKQITYL